MPVGQAIPVTPADPALAGADDDEGSCIVVVATDAPLTSKQLDRLARRAGLGLARVGSTGANGSGELIVSFSTGYRLPRRGGVTYDVRLVRDARVDPLFAAAIEATEEAVVNSLCLATTTVGVEGRVVEALPLDRLRAVMGLG